MKEVLDPRYYTKKYLRMRDQNNKRKAIDDTQAGSAINTLSTSQQSSSIQIHNTTQVKVPAPKTLAEKKKASRKPNRVNNYECMFI
jgi:hypothetical protein